MLRNVNLVDLGIRKNTFVHFSSHRAKGKRFRTHRTICRNIFQCYYGGIALVCHLSWLARNSRRSFILLQSDTCVTLLLRAPQKRRFTIVSAEAARIKNGHLNSTLNTFLSAARVPDYSFASSTLQRNTKQAA